MKTFIIFIFTLILISCHNNIKKADWFQDTEEKCKIELVKNLNDPNSYQNISWNYFKIPYESYYIFSNSYRAKNSFGALVIAEPVDFLVDSLKNKIYLIKGVTPSLNIANWMWKDWVENQVNQY